LGRCLMAPCGLGARATRKASPAAPTGGRSREERGRLARRAGTRAEPRSGGRATTTRRRWPALTGRGRCTVTALTRRRRCTDTALTRRGRCTVTATTRLVAWRATAGLGLANGCRRGDGLTAMALP